MSASVPAVTWSEYVRKTMAGDQQVQAAAKTNVSQATISRWLRGGQVGSADNIAAFARGYQRPVLEALVVAGVLTQEEASAPVTITRYEQPDDETLLDLLAARLRRDGEAGEGSGQQPAPMNQAGLGPAHEQHGHRMSEGGYTLAARDADDDAESEAQQIDP